MELTSILIYLLIISLCDSSDVEKCEKQRNNNYICRSFDFSTLSDEKQLSVTVEIGKLQPLTEIPSNPNIWSLEIKNSVNTVESNAFKNLPGLKVLIFEGNELPAIEPNSFSNLHLDSLVFNDNKITELKPQAFQNSQIDLLRIENNNITMIPKGVFNKLDLKQLDLFDNAISSIEDGALTDLPNLFTLKLSGNALTSFNSRNIFGNAPNLQLLHLQHNKFTSLDGKMFEGLQNLNFLLLGSNEITSIASGTFNLPNLKELDLGNNRIGKLDSNVLSGGGLRSLWQLYIHNNELTSLHTDFLSQLPDLRKILMDGNPWQCGCLDLVLKWIQDNLRNYEHGSQSGKPACIKGTKSTSICYEEYSLEKSELGSFKKEHAKNLEVYS